MESLTRRGTSRRASEDVELILLDEIAFFATRHKTINLTDALTVKIVGDRPATLRVNGKVLRFEGGVCRILASDLMGGANTCAVITGGRTLPCEALIRQGGYVMPAGIEQKRYVLDLYNKCQRLAEINEELEEKLRQFETDEEDPDIFNL